MLTVHGAATRVPIFAMLNGTRHYHLRVAIYMHMARVEAHLVGTWQGRVAGMPYSLLASGLYALQLP